MARPRTFDENQVVQAALAQFWHAGYTATSLDDLTEATGLGRSSLYGAFTDKHTLFMRALRAYCDGSVEQWREALAEPGPAHDRLDRFVRAVALGIADDAVRRGCLLAKSAAELSATDEEVAAVTADTFRRLHALLVEAVTEARAEGALDPDTDPQLLASLLLAVLRGIEALGKGGAGPDVVMQAAEQALALLPRPSAVPTA
ncbi:TetR family transcriptional regulator C-terminal domain-containing protein [Streptomyces sp. NPDC026672]|uniref:TetR/AcrR family transcriptional regulator n=1 Tax=unclassified Streptomyces TaxID=2593676 RepID=UPI00340720E8